MNQFKEIARLCNELAAASQELVKVLEQLKQMNERKVAKNG